MEKRYKNEEEKENNKNKNKILACGLVSGVLTKTLFAPFDRIKLFYQIQPMFQQYDQEKKKKNFNSRKEYITQNVLLTELNKTKKKQFSNTCLLKPAKNGKSQNVVFRNFKNCLNEIKKNSWKKKKKKIWIKETSHTTYLFRNTNWSKNSLHQAFKIILLHSNKNETHLNNLSKNSMLLSINNDVRHTIQNRMMLLNRTKTTNQPMKYQNIIQSFLFIVKEEGILGLWKGNLINTIRGGVVYSAKFGTNDMIKEKYNLQKKEERKREQIPRENADRSSQRRGASQGAQSRKFNYCESMIAGYASGIIQKTISYPLDLLSIRVALGINEKYLRQNASSNRKKSIFSIIREISTNEGIAGFFKGYIPTLLTGVPYVTLQMLFFDYYKNIFQNYFPHNSTSLSSVALYSSVAGSLSNVSSLVIVFPGDTVRKRMMNNGIDNKNYIYKGTIHCIKNIYYCEGFKNFYFGLFPSIVKCIPSGAIQFMSYEILKYMVSQS
ncbi:mitochondrial carrier protein, putative [Plasmodium ovale curtisi]|uniref:Mitochondrial carrier protein, putative n=1 Tax=Plasmodium ovale curtisi TaxID=864141 RepID=A0A1A8VZM4_PLAOA|nr:mitochondrial carrier protein, putative [Plasmodium ovale curtisi]SBS93417.1 mitochondrial carrier protein, putative [Plasmodium ovale curtisi]